MDAFSGRRAIRRAGVGEAPFTRAAADVRLDDNP